MDERSKQRKKRSKIWTAPLEELEQVVSNSLLLSDVLKYFGFDLSSSNYTTLKARLFFEDIDFDHIKLEKHGNKGRDNSHLINNIPLEECLVEHSTYGRGILKHRLLGCGLLKNECYECGLLPYWNNKPITLRIDHINGVSDDNRLENLRILCPNCHVQTDTFGGKRRKGTGKTHIRVSDIDPEWRHRPRPSTRKVERPSSELLNKLLWSKSMIKIAKDYGVSDRVIAKWAKSYKLETPPRNYFLDSMRNIPPKEDLEGLLLTKNIKNICKIYGISKGILTSWVDHYGLTKQPKGYWKKKINKQ
jgi:hypothetical protein